MKSAFLTLVRTKSGLAALEFAIIAPMLLLLLGGLADFALAFWYKRVLADSVAQGAQYAFLVGPNVSTGSVKPIVQQSLTLPAANVTVTGPACYCLSGNPAIATTTTCGATCAGGSYPGTYLSISALYAYTPILPIYSHMTNAIITESETVQLQ